MTFDLASLPPIWQTAVLEGPALRPPPGVQPNFINPPNQNSLGYALLVICGVVSTMMTGIRLYAKFITSKKFGIEDYLLLAALGVYGGFLFISFEIVVMPGLYVHQWNVRLKDLSLILYNVNNNYILYGVIIMLLKAGILLEWTRLFVPLGIHNAFWWTCHITLWVNVMFYIACTVVENFSCTPREKIWNKVMTEGHCVNNPALIMSSGIINLLSDVLIFTLPQKIIWGLHISNKKRVGICLIFATGVFGCVCGGFRLWSSIRALRSEDITFMVGPIGLWSHGEITAGFLVLCVPSAPKAFQNNALTKKVSSWVGSRKSSKGNVNSRRGLPSWYRAKVPGRPRHMDVSTLEECTLVTVRTDDESKKSIVSEQGPWVDDRIERAHPSIVHLRTHGLA
ncbi:hypothetical protein K458DRAFT_384427 [Lentithecium fluviatile CBS 122367]|uniref:Rhodopsin domain-containing protein n=1 Tax=Lentithecium fluviatile CBS 122367 TaxID=1168545 RepID=A0A6G1JGW1_9PLEO|nr:hypothetical protein K458DRAFT_384427 [Lentithecium fluviatile CBS 122367]